MASVGTAGGQQVAVRPCSILDVTVPNPGVSCLSPHRSVHCETESEQTAASGKRYCTTRGNHLAPKMLSVYLARLPLGSTMNNEATTHW